MRPRLEITLHEGLSGGVAPPDRPLEARPIALDLTLHGRGLLEVALGAPFAVHGAFDLQPAGRADAPPPGLGLPAHGAAWGTARLLAPRGVFYDLRLARGEDAPPSEVLVLRGARRFVWGDLYASATTFDGELARGDVVVARVRLRFDARDDLGALFRSFRLGSSGILGDRRSA